MNGFLFIILSKNKKNLRIKMEFLSKETKYRENKSKWLHFIIHVLLSIGI